jgi:hypothetical protein
MVVTTILKHRQFKRLRHERIDAEPLTVVIYIGRSINLMEITYISAGDYFLPNIVLSDPLDAPPLGYYGLLHKEYLQEEKPALYSMLLLTERLYPLCREIDEAAATRLTTIPNRNTANEIILSELVYC